MRQAIAAIFVLFLRDDYLRPVRRCHRPNRAGLGQDDDITVLTLARA